VGYRYVESNEDAAVLSISRPGRERAEDSEPSDIVKKERIFT